MFLNAELGCFDQQFEGEHPLWYMEWFGMLWTKWSSIFWNHPFRQVYSQCKPLTDSSSGQLQNKCQIRSAPLKTWQLFNTYFTSPRPFFVRLTKNYAICCSRQILMTGTVLNVDVANFGLPNTMFMWGKREMTGNFHLSRVGARVKTGLFTSGHTLKGTPPTPR